MKKMQRLVAALSAIPLVAAMAMNAMAEPVNTVTVTKFHQSYGRRVGAVSGSRHRLTATA